LAEDDSAEAERRALVRAVRQRLESLSRAGLAGIPAPPTGAKPSNTLAAPRDSPARRPKVEVRPTAPVSPSVEPLPAPVLAQPVPPANVFAWAKPAAKASGPPREFVASASRLAGVPSLFGSVEFDAPPVPACDRPARLSALAAEVAGCRKCRILADSRTQTVFGTGSPETRLMFIGEAPGADEDRLGEPFVGRAGQLLNDMITKGMGLSRDQVYIANILKCRPPDNRTPTIEEASNCVGYLEEQIAIIRPEFLCLLGRVALQELLKTTLSMSKLRGKWHQYRGIPTIVTYHPAYLLRKPEFKRESWEDLQMLMAAMGLKPPQRTPEGRKPADGAEKSGSSD
jgi:DNA polymerase